MDDLGSAQERAHTGEPRFDPNRLRGRVYMWFDRQLPMTEFLDRHITAYPTPRNLNYWWNFGSLLGFLLVLQILTGFFLATQYKGDPTLAFESVQRIIRDVEWGWMIQALHATGSSFLFAALYIHMLRGMAFGSYKEPRKLLWHLGVIMFLLMILAAFSGYLLPWGQMSYWAAQVITDIFTAIPLIGDELTEWIRGGFVVGAPTLTRMVAIHFVLVPIGFAVLVLLHLAALHRVGSGNPTGVDIDKKSDQAVTFHPLFTAKDAWFGLAVFALLFAFAFFLPDFFLNPDNWIEADPLRTPSEIEPEWYFLPFFTILRAIPNKLLGVIALLSSLSILFFLPVLDRLRVRNGMRRPIFRWAFLIFLIDLIALGWIGAHPPLGAYLVAGLIATVIYFLFFLSLPLISRVESRMIQEDER